MVKGGERLLLCNECLNFFLDRKQIGEGSFSFSRNGSLVCCKREVLGLDDLHLHKH